MCVRHGQALQQRTVGRAQPQGAVLEQFFDAKHG
jgi:hypothetical protein